MTTKHFNMFLITDMYVHTYYVHRNIYVRQYKDYKYINYVYNNNKYVHMYVYMFV